jgi:hypothetical protein
VEGAASSEPASSDSNQVAAVSDSTTNVALVGNLADTNAPLIGVLESDVPDITKADVKPIVAERPLPPTIRSNSPVADIIKLVESGVEESVLLSFITNSTSTFSLKADDIVYLNDIGISGTFITAILEHDKALRAANITTVWSNQAPAPVETTNLAPQDMAPQVAEESPPAPAQEESAPPPSTVTYNNFYSSLSPYGTWVHRALAGSNRVWSGAFGH